MTSTALRIDEDAIPSIPAEALMAMTPEQLEQELSKYPHDSIEALDVESELVMRAAPRTARAQSVYRLPSLEERALAAFAYGLHLVSLPKKQKSVAMDDVLRALGSEG